MTFIYHIYAAVTAPLPELAIFHTLSLFHLVKYSLMYDFYHFKSFIKGGSEFNLYVFGLPCGYLKVIAQTLFSNSLFQIVDNIYMSCRLTILYNRLKHILNLFGILS